MARESAVLTTKQAAELLGVSTRRVRALLETGALEGELVGRDWLVEEDSVRQRMDKGPKAGRPPIAEGKDAFSCTLMNAAHEVACVVVDRRSSMALSVEVIDAAYAPPGACSRPGKMTRASVSGWLADRKLSSARPDLKTLLRERGYKNESHYLLENLALSLSDCYWLKPMGIELAWPDVSLFSNRYVDSADPFSPRSAGRSPSTGGAQAKWWEQDKDLRSFLIKKGRLDSLAEKAATMMFDRVLEEGDYVPYDLVERGGELCSRCGDFIEEGFELVAMEDVVACHLGLSALGDYKEYVSLCKKLGVKGAEVGLAKMIACDYIMANRDRRPRNLGLIRDIEALEYIGPAPLFDSGQSFFRSALDRGRFEGPFYYASNPFSEIPERQLALVDEWEWLEVGRLEKYPQEVAELYLSYGAIDNDAADCMKELLGSRIRRVEETALEVMHIHAVMKGE